MRVLIKTDNDQLQLIETDVITQDEGLIRCKTDLYEDLIVDCKTDFDVTVLLQQCLREAYMDLSNYSCVLKLKD